MADEQHKNTGGQITTTAEEKPRIGQITTTAEEKPRIVQMSQSDLDALIDKKYAKGAEKANSKLLEDLGVTNVDDLKTIVTTYKEAEEKNKSDLDKANDTINTLNGTITELTNKLGQSQTESKINKLAVDNGITEVDYFKYEYEKASKKEDFEEAKFVTNLLESKGSILKVNLSNKENNLNNPRNHSRNMDGSGETITMSDYSMLSKEERAKYTPNQVIKG